MFNKNALITYLTVIALCITNAVKKCVRLLTVISALTGVTLNWGVLLAWSGIHGCLQTPVIPLYLACVLYTIFYDTVYSHQVSVAFPFFITRK